MVTHRRFSIFTFLVCLSVVFLGCHSVTAGPENNTVYEIFVRSFADGNGDGIGDLKGLNAKLDYLNDGDSQTDDDLEVGILWLMPIYKCDSYHGYGVTDFYQLDPAYGTMQEFNDFIAAAHQRGLRVILDIPFNHTSNQHPWFQDAFENPSTSQYRNFYFIAAGEEKRVHDWHWKTNRSGTTVSYFGDFGKTMPDLNMDNPDVRAEVKKIAKFWLDKGADGFRLDAAKHIYATADELSWDDIKKNNSWWKEFCTHVETIKPNTIIVGEVLGNEELLHHFAWSLPGLLDEPFMHKIRAFGVHPNPGFIEWWKKYLNRARENNSDFDLMPFVSSHDANPRLASYYEKYIPDRKEPTYRWTMHVLMTVGKYPILYYGDEIMQAGWKWNGNSIQDGGDGSGIYDETLREPLPWDQSGSDPYQTTWFTPRFDTPSDGISVKELEQAGTTSMPALVKALTNFRAEQPDFANAELGRILSDTEYWLVFERTGTNATYLVLINNMDAGNNYKFHDGWYPEYKNAKLMFWSDATLKKFKDTSGGNDRINDKVYVPPYGLCILKR